MTQVLSRDELQAVCAERRARGERIVFANGCFDILHAGHVQLLNEARTLGDFLVVGVNADASVKRLKGETRPVNSEDARAFVLSGLRSVGAVSIFGEDTPDALIEVVQPHVHVKGGDYRPEDLPEAATVRRHGGEVVIVPLREGFSTTSTIAKLQAGESATSPTAEVPCVLVIPARFGSTRFPGKPLALLQGRPVIEHVVRAGLQSQASRPVIVATDDERIATAITGAFGAEDAVPAMTSPTCQTGTDRIAEVLQTRFAGQQNMVVINVQGDEPFIDPRHVDALIDAMRADRELQMATLATPIRDAAQVHDPNVVKVVTGANESALYFSRATIPHQRSGEGTATLLRHIGVYAYSAAWLQRMAALPPTQLEQIEMLEQLRALENGVGIRVVVVEDVVSIAIDTPSDLEAAERYLQARR